MKRKNLGMKAGFLAAAICAVSLAGCSSDVTSYEASIRCVQLPADDEPLRKWYADQPGVGDLSVTREEDTVRVRYAGSGKVKHLVPPFAELGYARVRSVDWKESRQSAWAMLTAWLADAPLVFWLLFGCVVGALVAIAGVRVLRSRRASKAA